MGWSDYIPRFIRRERVETSLPQPAQQPEQAVSRPEAESQYPIIAGTDGRAETVKASVAVRRRYWHEITEDMPRQAAAAKLIDVAGRYRSYAEYVGRSRRLAGIGEESDLVREHKLTARALLAEARTLRQTATVAAAARPARGPEAVRQRGVRA
jgi:hypothetical protein